jgi:predicted transcriptional regulator
MPEDQSVDRSELLALTAEIVAAHVGNNAVAGTEVGALIQSVFDTLRGLATDEVWSRRRGQMIRVAEAPFADVVPAPA